jgi:hypothetical protein
MENSQNKSSNENIIKNNLIQELNNIQHTPIDKPNYDGNYILLNRTIKFLLNFLLAFIFLKLIIGKYPDLTLNQLILLFCTVSSVLLYILDSTYPSCSL